jgi:integral membrane sensor domain MASE1
MQITIDLAVLLAIIIVIRLRRRTEARSRNDELLTVLIVLVFGVLVAPTSFGHAVAGLADSVVHSKP